MNYIDCTWSQFKATVNAKSMKPQMIEDASFYRLFAFDGPFSITCLLNKDASADTSDFESSMKSSCNQTLETKKDPEGIPIVVADKGAEQFDTVITHDWSDSSSWPSPSDSTWILAPSASNKTLIVPKAEVQFTHDVQLGSQETPGEFYFDIWAYNPLFDQGQAPTADDPTFVPGVSSGNPLRFMVKRYIYKGIQDVFNFGNAHYTMNANVDGFQHGITTVQFNYDQKILLVGSMGMQVRFSLKDHQPMGGSFITVSLVTREVAS